MNGLQTFLLAYWCVGFLLSAWLLRLKYKETTFTHLFYSAAVAWIWTPIQVLWEARK